MEKPETKSKWEDLAREIGAELTPEAEQRAETHTAASEADVTPPAAPTPLPSLPKKRAANWAGLADELGLPPLPEESPAIEPPAAAQPKREESRRPQPRESSQSREPQQREPQQRESRQRDQSSRDSRGHGAGRGRGTQRRDERRDTTREGGESTSRRHERSGSRRDRDEGRRGEKRRGHSEPRRQRDQPQDEPSRPRSFDTEPPEVPLFEKPPVAETTSRPPEPESTPKSPAVSLWHKIFGAPAEPVAKYADVPTEALSEEPETETPPSERDDFEGGEIRSLSGEDVPEAAYVEEHGEDFVTTDEPGDRADQGRGRTRRRRRGGRGRRPGGRQRDARSTEPRVHQQGGDDQLDVEFDDLADDEDDLSADESMAPSEHANGDVDLLDSENEKTSTRSRSLSAAQRAIPSWDEAIGYIVESNMQNRSQRRPPSRSDSRSSPPHGRSRGRRK